MHLALHVQHSALKFLSPSHCSLKFLEKINSKFYHEDFPLQNIKTRHKMKHNKMGENHLIKTVTHSWLVSTKIKKQSKQVLNKLPREKEG